MIDANDVYPVPDDEDQHASGLGVGPEMSGETKPTRDGRYLRFFDDVESWAWSWFTEGEWTRDGFFASDIQNAPWRRAVRADSAACLSMPKDTQ